MRRTLTLLLLLCAALLPRAALGAPAPLVVELFTSQSCSSCPPADALLAELRRTRPDLLPLDFHVDYWNHLGWRDPYSSAEATDRQRRYAAALDSEVCTPQLVVAGTHQVVGSDRDAVGAALAAASSEQAAATPIALRLGRSDAQLTVQVGPGSGEGELILVGFDDAHTTSVGRGENGGRVLDEVNVVRSLRQLGRWSGRGLQLRTPAPAGQRAALLLQDRSGRILAAALLPQAE
jgi:hypothetical protein